MAMAVVSLVVGFLVLLTDRSVVLIDLSALMVMVEKLVIGLVLILIEGMEDMSAL